MECAGLSRRTSGSTHGMKPYSIPTCISFPPFGLYVSPSLSLSTAIEYYLGLKVTNLVHVLHQMYLTVVVTAPTNFLSLFPHLIFPSLVPHSVVSQKIRDM